MKKSFLKAVLYCIAILTIQIGYAQTEKYAALAVDRSNGFYYGFAHDYDNRNDAEQRALSECKKRGGNCSIVLVYSGGGCVVYRTVDGNVGTAYGWGVAKTKQEADAIAITEAKKRSNGKMPTNHVWACNSSNSPLKDLSNVPASGAAKPESNTSLSKTQSTDEYLSFGGTKMTATGDCGGQGNATIGTDDESFSAILYNVPSNGNVSVSARMFTDACTSCPALILTDGDTMTSFVATGGTFSRSGNRISFSVTVVQLLEIGSGGSGKSLSGSFTCEN
ncbi:DUF4189 domain-containing protein [Sphingobacterium paucimobilis]|uniref:DUF4189 domain-containing protein n=1 Tax=Sphingobacterium paucimobilis HER1398 TaxID=1346330 RepID=U2HF81_9SPHI|nr:DUF4189 domain-containing protein [Sphingobacterium paucimobilis]ERJ60431.1 hypothetical protein M472_16890 [Sphingobacterium paucimobilis HER1398]